MTHHSTQTKNIRIANSLLGDKNTTHLPMRNCNTFIRIDCCRELSSLLRMMRLNNSQLSIGNRDPAILQLDKFVICTHVKNSRFDFAI
jgi:hypothetical protein